MHGLHLRRLLKFEWGICMGGYSDYQHLRGEILEVKVGLWGL